MQRRNYASIASFWYPRSIIVSVESKLVAGLGLCDNYFFGLKQLRKSTHIDCSLGGGARIYKDLSMGSYFSKKKYITSALFFFYEKFSRIN